MKRLFVFLTVLFFSIHISVSSVFAEQIDSFSSQITVNQDGTISNIERIEYDFGNEYKHGIVRIFPKLKTNSEGKKYILDYIIGSVTDEINNRYQFTTSEENNNLLIKIGDPDKTITGAHVYVIDYSVSGALTYFSDHDELYWNINGNDWKIPTEQVAASIILPSSISFQQIQTVCYTGYKDSKKSTCSQSVEQNTAIFQTGLMNPGEGLTATVGFPKGIVAVLEPREYVPFWDTIWGKLTLIGLVVLAILWYFLYPIWVIIKWWMSGRDPRVGGPVTAWYDPPATKDGRKLLPGETGTLVDETVNLQDISATIVDLARRGYFKIEERKKNDFYLVRSKTKSSEVGLTPYELILYNGLFAEGSIDSISDIIKQFSPLAQSFSASFTLKNGKFVKNVGSTDQKQDEAVQKLDNILNKKVTDFEDEVRVKDLKLVETVRKVQENLYKLVVTQGFFDKNPNSTRTFYSVIGGLALFTLNIQLALIAFFIGRNMPKKTIFGAQQTMIARSLKNFLKGQERQLTFQAKNQMWFEKLLPYAVAFGVEKYWAEQFKDINLTPPSWYSTYNNSPFNSVYFTSSLGSSFSSIAHAATPTSSSSGFSSGFSGGSSGGGGGGGGGGSW